MSYTTRLRRRDIFPRGFLALTTLWAGSVLALAGPCWAAEPAGDFRPYPLRQARAADVQATLSPLLPSGSEVVADAANNRVLVRGPAIAHQVADKVIGSLDRAAPAEAGASTPTLKVYASPTGQARSTAAGLQAEFGAAPGVRIVPDERTAQVLVVAPAEVHTRVAARLADGQAAPAAAAGQTPSAGATRVSSDALSSPAARPSEIQLARLTGEQFETGLSEMLGDRLRPLAAASPNVGAYRLTLSGGRQFDISINRRTHLVTAAGSAQAAHAFVQLVRAVDASEAANNESTQLVALRTTRPEDAQKTVDAVRASSNARREGIRDATAERADPLAAQISRQRSRQAGGADLAVAQAKPVPRGERTAAGPPKPPVPGQTPAKPEEGAGMIGPVQIELLDGLDVLIIRGNPRDVRRVKDIIDQIEKLSKVTEPAIVVHQLDHVNSLPLATLVTQLYADVFASRQGTVSITALIKPNALLLIGRKESVDRMIDLVKRLDVPVPPDSQFQVFRLERAVATTAQTTIQGFYPEQGGLAPVVRVTADARSNALIVQASPRDMAEVAAMIARLDTKTSDSVNELKIFKLTHATAEELLPILQDAIQAQATAATAARPAGTTVPGAAAPAAPATGTGTGTRTATGDQRSAMLQFLTVDVQGQPGRRISSGILSDVRITANARANTLIVSSPAENLPLIEALIKQLDQPPAVRAEIKVFTIVNGDSAALADMLGALFGQPATAAGQGAAAATPPISAAAEGESSLVPLRFAVDQRTNSIIAAGSRGDLIVVEAILLRLDESDVRKRKSTVYRLKNAPATDVANAINNFLSNERQVQQIAPGLASPLEQVEREMIVVPEPVSNSLIVSATPRFFDEINRLVEQLDQRPPMVMIQVLIAEVTLNSTDEFGIELGLQDSVLFNRSTAGVPGFNFVGQPLGTTNFNPAAVGTQGTSSLAPGRSNTDLGFGGLVLSASSESVSVLLRALQEKRRLDVLSRPQVMTIDNQAAYVMVGQTVPTISGVSLTTFGQTNSIVNQNVGLILQVIPRISPDNLVVMEIDAERSDVGPEATGIPISVSATGQVIRSPRINKTLAQTTISALNGQTVVLGGLLTKQKSTAHRQVPLLGDVPVLGRLFRFDIDLEQRTELLIIMTPHVVKNEEDAERLKRVEAARMHWCLADVIALHGDGGLRGRQDEWSDAETPVVYPDAPQGPELVPTPTPADDRPAPTLAPRTQLPAPPRRPATPGFGAGPRAGQGVAPEPANGQPANPPPPSPPPVPSAGGPSPGSGGVEAAVFNGGSGTMKTEVRYGPPPPRTTTIRGPVYGPETPPSSDNPLRRDDRS